MGRSAVLTGRIDARDRAKLRGRLDAEVQPEADPYEELWAWLERSDYGEGPSAEAARTDLDEYLRRTGHFEIPAHERLRHLAIFLEAESGAVLEVVDRVYEAGLRLEPNDHLLWHSRGITTRLAAGLEQGAKQERVAAQALRWLERALELDDTDPHVPYSLGMWHYEFGSGKEAAQQWFERVIALEPEHGWALLYRAHCLHDLQRWSEAVAAMRRCRFRPSRARRCGESICSWSRRPTADFDPGIERVPWRTSAASSSASRRSLTAGTCSRSGWRGKHAKAL